LSNSNKTAKVGGKMKLKAMVSVVIAPFFLILVSCGGPGIGLKTDFQQANFEVKKSTKLDVVRYLGLPQKIMKDPDGREHYIYEGSTRLVSACIGCGSTNMGVGLIPSYINETGVRNGAEYVFDENGLLIAKFEPQK